MTRCRFLAVTLSTIMTVAALSACSGGEPLRTVTDRPYEVDAPSPTPSPTPAPTPIPVRRDVRWDAQCASASAYTDRTPEISDFGRQVAEEFLSQFDSLFDRSRFFLEYDDFWWDSTVEYMLFGEDGAGDVPFIMDMNIGRFIASSFWLYDLNYNGIPDIVISFVLTTWSFSTLFRFVDGEYVAISTDRSNLRFFYDQDGNMIMSSDGGFEYICFEVDIMHVGDTVYPRPTWALSWEAQGLTEISSLTDLTEDIRQSITQRLFADID